MEDKFCEDCKHYECYDDGDGYIDEWCSLDNDCNIYRYEAEKCRDYEKNE